MLGWGFQAYLPIDKWLKPSPVVIRFNPGHDTRIFSAGSIGEESVVAVEVIFSDETNCTEVQNAIPVTSTTEDHSVVLSDDVSCQKITDSTVRVSRYTGTVTGQIPGVWKIEGNLTHFSDGVQMVNIANVSILGDNTSTNAVNHFLIRIGQVRIPWYSHVLRITQTRFPTKTNDSRLYVSHQSATPRIGNLAGLIDYHTTEVTPLSKSYPGLARRRKQGRAIILLWITGVNRLAISLISDRAISLATMQWLGVSIYSFRGHTIDTAIIPDWRRRWSKIAPVSGHLIS